jgi:hypothetical protein
MSAERKRTTHASPALDRRQPSARRSAAREGADAQPSGRRKSDIASGAGDTALRTQTERAATRRSTRDGREPLVVYLRPESIKALKFAALEEDSTASAIVAEAVSTWLEARVRRRPA